MFITIGYGTPELRTTTRLVISIIEQLIRDKIKNSQPDPCYGFDEIFSGDIDPKNCPDFYLEKQAIRFELLRHYTRASSFGQVIIMLGSAYNCDQERQNLLPHFQGSDPLNWLDSPLFEQLTGERLEVDHSLILVPMTTEDIGRGLANSCTEVSYAFTKKPKAISALPGQEPKAIAKEIMELIFL